VFILNWITLLNVEKNQGFSPEVSSLELTFQEKRRMFHVVSKERAFHSHGSSSGAFRRGVGKDESIFLHRKSIAFAQVALALVAGGFGAVAFRSSTPSGNSRVTTVSSNWLDTSSEIVPNFGDYTDNYVQVQPFEAPAHTS
jgi:hypothetical protein